jgi:prepilin-type N-terminal cleavage/methylation domain-containing protein
MKKGFSLIEVLIVLGVVGVIASIGTIFSMGSVSRSYTLSERDLLVGLLTQTRAKALANVHESAHSLHIATSTYVLYEGTIFSVSNSTNKHIPRVSKATLTGLDTTTFLPLTADVASSGVITVSGDTQSYEIEVNSIGRINW